MPTPNQIGDMRWLVERDLRNELGVPPKTALNKDKIEFHKRQLALLDLANRRRDASMFFTDGRCWQSAPREKRQAVLCPYADGGETSAGAEPASAGRRECRDAVVDGRFYAGWQRAGPAKKTAGIMLYGLQLAMVNARFYDFQGHQACGNGKESAKTKAKPQRTRRSTKKEEDHAELPTSEGRTLPQRTQRNTEEEASDNFTEKDAEVAKKEEQRALATVTPRSEGRALLQTTQRSAEEEPSGDFTAENAEVAQEEKPEEGTALRVEHSLEPRNAEGIPGVESAKSIFFGVEAGEGVADNRPVMPPSEPPRKVAKARFWRSLKTWGTTPGGKQEVNARRIRARLLRIYFVRFYHGHAG